MKGESVTTDKLLSDLVPHGPHPGGGDDNSDGGLPPYHQSIPQEYLLTDRAVQAIVKSWDISEYNPPGMDAASWLGRVHKLCEAYGVPVTQRALCAMHHMRTDCQEEAYATECYEMTWDQFAKWILKYDGVC